MFTDNMKCPNPRCSYTTYAKALGTSYRADPKNKDGGDSSRGGATCPECGSPLQPIA